jgi:hypothetical protein
MLLDHSADISAPAGKFGTALQAASDQGHSEVVQLLLESGVDIDARERYGTALRLASAGDHDQAVQILLNAGADVNTQDEFNRTALHMAAGTGRVEVVETLIKHGTSVTQVDRYGLNALNWAILGPATLELMQNCCSAELPIPENERNNILRHSIHQLSKELLDSHDLWGGFCTILLTWSLSVVAGKIRRCSLCV